MTTEVVTLIVSIAVIVIVALLRDRFGLSKAAEYAKWATGSLNTANMYLEAAKQAVVYVEEDIKKHQDLSPDELRDAAVSYAQKVLSTWGVYVSEEALEALEAMIEKAYQDLKGAKEEKQNWLMGEPNVTAQ